MEEGRGINVPRCEQTAPSHYGTPSFHHEVVSLNSYSNYSSFCAQRFREALLHVQTKEKEGKEVEAIVILHEFNPGDSNSEKNV